jgi:hypothetical protein
VLDLKKERRPLGRKLWITYRLQGLSTEKFIKAVEGILRGEDVLLKPPETDSLDDEDSGQFVSPQGTEGLQMIWFEYGPPGAISSRQDPASRLPRGRLLAVFTRN